MADILIKGLALPKEGEYGLKLGLLPNGKVEGTQQIGGMIRLIEATAIELPPHGDLIDRDKIKLKKDPVLNWYVVGELLKEMPVIVEASNGTDN